MTSWTSVRGGLARVHAATPSREESGSRPDHTIGGDRR